MRIEIPAAELTRCSCWTRTSSPNYARSASALGFGIHTEGETLDELRCNVREAVDCYFDGDTDRPRLIRLHYVKDEVLVA